MELTPLEVFAIGFSLKVALASLCLAVLLAVAASLLLTRVRFRGKVVVETLFLSPLVLPPLVTGYLLLLLSRNGPVGAAAWDLLGVDLAFAPPGAVLAAAVVSFPLVLRPVKLSMEAIDPSFLNVSRSLGLSRTRTFFRVVLPMIAPGLLSGAVLGFARSLGEFGAAIMVAGSVPFRTTTMPLAIFSFFNQANGDAPALRLVLISVAVSFASLAASEVVARRWRRA